MRENFEKALRIELKYEGGKDDDPIDPGGRTNQGIIQRVYSAWRIRHGKQAQDVFLMTDEERNAIYWQNYFLKVRFDELPAGLDLVLVDGGINSGPSQSIKWVQRALGLRADGVLGDVTMQRIVDHPDHDVLIRQTLDRRRAFLRNLKTYYHFGKGWEARVNNLQKVAQAWAVGSVGPAIEVHPNGNKKAVVLDAKPVPSTAPADATTSGGVISTTLSTIQTTLDPLKGSIPWMDQAVIAVLVLGALATVFGIVYGIYVRRKRAELNDALDLVDAYGVNDNSAVPLDVKLQYADPDARGTSTGNIAEGVTTQSGRVAGDTEKRTARSEDMAPWFGI